MQEVLGLSEWSYVVILNWNGWEDTIECLKSLCLLEGGKIRIVVCDNASSDRSLEHIRSWAEGEERCRVADPRYGFLVEDKAPPRRVAAWRVGQPASSTGDADLVLIQTGANLGFAAGCNVGLRYVLERDDAEFVWLLNNDTVVARDALGNLLEKMRERPDVGLCGSTLLHYFEPEAVQCRGGYDFNPWTARVKHIAASEASAALSGEEAVEARLRYVCGASVFVRIAFLRRVGLMSEQYFLYFEEIDWATRARGVYGLGYCAASVVYHKEGRSIGSHRSSASRSLSSEWYLSRNRIVLMRTHYPARVAVCLAWVGLAALARFSMGRTVVAKTMLAGAWNGLRCKLGVRGAAGE
jgi:GT2 family glycosyltransferase